MYLSIVLQTVELYCQQKFLGHVVRKELLQILVVTGFVKGKDHKGGGETYMPSLEKRKDLIPLELIHFAR